MDKLYDINTIKSVMNYFGIEFNKKYGQNFLTEKRVLDEIVDSVQTNEKSAVIEIGPGIGTLTNELSKKFEKVLSIEIDKALIPVLDYTLSDIDNVEIINEDFLKIDLKSIIKEKLSEYEIHVVANLPYYITTPIIMKLLEEDAHITSITVMVQKEVGDRLTAKSGTKEYGSLTVACGYYANVEKLFIVKPHCFTPQPNVDSLVIRMNKRQYPPVEVMDKEFFFSIIKGAFQQRRKTLVNSLSNYPFLDISKDDITHVIEEMGLDTRIRGERLNIDDFAKLSNKLMKNP